MSTDFLDVLETQLDAAARRRYARHQRRAPRQLFGEIAVAAVAVATIALAVVVLGGGSRSADHSARTPAGGASGNATALRGTRVSVLNASTRPGAARRVADRLTAAGAHIVRVGDDPSRLAGTEVAYARGAGGAALAVSQFLTHIPPQLAALRLSPVDAATRAIAGDAPVVVRVGRDDIVTPLATAPVVFRTGCPAHSRELASGDIEAAMDSVLQAWPAEDRAILGTSGSVNGSPYEGAVARACGTRLVDRTVFVRLDRTARASQVTVLVSCDGHGRWIVWRRLP